MPTKARKSKRTASSPRLGSLSKEFKELLAFTFNIGLADLESSRIELRFLFIIPGDSNGESIVPNEIA